MVYCEIIIFIVQLGQSVSEAVALSLFVCLCNSRCFLVTCSLAIVFAFPRAGKTKSLTPRGGSQRCACWTPKSAAKSHSVQICDYHRILLSDRHKVIPSFRR